MPQLTISDLLRDTARTLADRWSDLAGLLVLPAIATAIVYAGAEAAVGGPIAPPSPALLVVSFAVLLVQTPAMAAWCRICLGVDAPIDRLGPVDSRATAFLRAEIALIAAGVGVAALSMLFGLIVAGAGAQAQQSGLAFAVLGLAAFAILSPRLMLCLPAAATGAADRSLRGAWARSKGCTAPLILGMLAFLPPGLLVGVMAEAIGALGPRIFEPGFAASLWSALPPAFASLALQGVVLTVVVRAHAALSGRGAPNGSAAP